MSTCCRTRLPCLNCRIMPEKSPLSKRFNTSRFTENMRVRLSNGSIGYAEWLLSVGYGVASPDKKDMF